MPRLDSTGASFLDSSRRRKSRGGVLTRNEPRSREESLRPDWTSTGPCWLWRVRTDRPRAAETVCMAKTSQVSQSAAAPCRPAPLGELIPVASQYPMIEEFSQIARTLSATLQDECAGSHTVFHALPVKTQVQAFSRQSDYGATHRLAQSSLAVCSFHPIMNSSSFPDTITADCMTHLRSQRRCDYEPAERRLVT